MASPFVTEMSKDTTSAYRVQQHDSKALPGDTDASGSAANIGGDDLAASDATLAARLPLLRFVFLASTLYDPTTTSRFLFTYRLLFQVVAWVCMGECAAVLVLGGPSATVSVFLRVIVTVAHVAYSTISLLATATQQRRLRLVRRLHATLRLANYFDGDRAVTRWLPLYTMVGWIGFVITLVYFFLPLAADPYYTASNNCQGGSHIAMCVFGYTHTAFWVLLTPCMCACMAGVIPFALIMICAHAVDAQNWHDQWSTQYRDIGKEDGRGKDVAALESGRLLPEDDMQETTQQLFLSSYQKLQDRVEATVAALQPIMNVLVPWLAFGIAMVISYLLFRDSMVSSSRDLQQPQWLADLVAAQVGLFYVITLWLFLYNMASVTNAHLKIRQMLSRHSFPGEVAAKVHMLHLIDAMRPGYKLAGLVVTRGHIMRLLYLLLYTTTFLLYRILTAEAVN